MPPGFEYPEQTQIWVNSAVNLSEEPRDNRAWSAIARLNSNVDLKQAQTRVSGINAQSTSSFTRRTMAGTFLFGRSTNVSFGR